jgi:hypothetical protein
VRLFAGVGGGGLSDETHCAPSRMPLCPRRYAVALHLAGWWLALCVLPAALLARKRLPRELWGPHAGTVSLQLDLPSAGGRRSRQTASGCCASRSSRKSLPFITASTHAAIARGDSVNVDAG